MILRFVCGVLLGVFFYGCLWLTVRRLATTRHPFALTLASLFVRMGLTLGGFFLVIDGRWQNAVMALLGFTVVRLTLAVERSRSCT